jgi:MFS transporter, SET family, sugar efflux transporter
MLRVRRFLEEIPEYPLLAIPVLLLGFAASFSMPFISLFGTNVIHMTPLALGTYLSSVAISSIVLSMVMARISDRLPSRKPVVLVGLVSAGLGYLVLALVRDYLTLLVLAR